jgi:endoglucanase
MNLGNALDAPSEGRWGVTLDESYFAAIADAGFDSVRLPVRWSAHASEHAPWTIEQTFLDRVAWAVDTALDHGLAVVLNVHHYERLMELPEVETDRFLAIWQQIAARFSEYPDLLMFELLNEPSHRLDAERWNALLWPTIERLRRSNPVRTLIVGPALFNHIRQLDTLSLPVDDRHLIVTVHYYQPRQFTHQGASWQTGSAQWLGTTWHGSASEREPIEGDLRAAARWAQHHGRPLYLGEFGVIREADPASRAAWTRFVARTAESLGYSWAYWEFASGFSVYDTDRRQWDPAMLDALIPGSKATASILRP